MIEVFCFMKNKAIKISAFLSVFLILAAFCAGCSRTGSGNSQQPTTAQTVRVTFPEGKTVVSIAQLLEDNKVCTRDEFILAVNSVSTENEFANSIENLSDRPFALEGYLFPDTYDFYIGESAQNVLSRFLKNTSSKLTDEYKTRASEIGFSMDEIVKLASIIQTEAGVESEMKKVSSVLHNRLKSKNYLSRLQCDATYFYISDYVIPYLTGGSEDKELSEKMAKLYNTYNFSGLPAGPICNPGKAAIEAALYPADTDYYYFVTDSSGNYYYSETYEQHAAKCNELGV